MFKNKGFLSFLFVIVTFIFYYTFNSQNSVEKPPSLEYASRLSLERKAKDKYLLEGKESPIEDKASFKGLKYFDISEKFKVIAQLVLSQKVEKLVIQTSDNKQEVYEKYGNALLKMDGRDYSLTIYKTENPRLLFLPFNDLTNKKETYGGGRFLDIPISDVSGNKIILDFNLAYHPYCAYNHTYICPIPPKENKIESEIKVGERL